MADFSFALTGDKKLIRAFHDLPEKVKKKALKKAVREAGKDIIPIARRYAKAGGRHPKRRFGALAASIGIYVPKQRRGTVAAAIVGPRYDRRVVTLVGRVKTKKLRWKRLGAKESKTLFDYGVTAKTRGTYRVVNPGLYGWLVELGHGGKHPAPAHPFMRPAFAAAKSEMLRTVEQVLWLEIANFRAAG